VRRESIRFREKVRPSDAENVRGIVESSGFFHKGEIEIAVELVTERMAHGEESGYFFIFAEQRARMVGYTCFGPIAGTLASYDLYWIAVEEGRRRTGIGKDLLRLTEGRIKERGGHRIYIETSSLPHYEPTRSFYERSGYRAEALLKNFYAPGDDKMIFVKEI
jgi:GNAT superfamily N-acetyltransferase